MAKTMIRNALGEKIVSHTLPMSTANAITFADKYLEGTYKIYEASVDMGSDAGVVLAYDVIAFVKNEATGKKAYLRFIAKSTKNEAEIRTALMGMTINGILVDYVSILNFAPLTFA